MQQPDASALTYPLDSAVREAFEKSDTCLLVIGPPNSAFTIAVRKDGDSYQCFDSQSQWISYTKWKSCDLVDKKCRWINRL